MIVICKISLFYKVPGRMGLLITLTLIAWNIYGSTKAPPSRGFSKIESWIIGVQCPIIFAILEYTCILALKRAQSKESKAVIETDRIVKIIDFFSFIFSLVFFIIFNVIYWELLL